MVIENNNHDLSDYVTFPVRRSIAVCVCSRTSNHNKQVGCVRLLHTRGGRSDKLHCSKAQRQAALQQGAALSLVFSITTTPLLLFLLSAPGTRALWKFGAVLQPPNLCNSLARHPQTDQQTASTNGIHSQHSWMVRIAAIRHKRRYTFTIRCVC